MDDTRRTRLINGWSLQIDGALHAVPAGTQADRIAHAILSDQSTFVSASWDDTKLDPTSTPDGYATPQGPDILFDNNTATLAGFPPLPSTDFGILTTGDANLADDTPQDQSQSSGVGDGFGSPATFPPAATRRSTSRRCGSGSTSPMARTACRWTTGSSPRSSRVRRHPYNDAFIAELGHQHLDDVGHDDQRAERLRRPTPGRGRDVNGVGPVAVSAAEASDTTYDAATGLVTTKTPITPGAHTVILSIFDQGDPILRLAGVCRQPPVHQRGPGTCKPPFVAADAGATARAPAPARRPAAVERVHGRQQDRVQERLDGLTVTVPGPGVLQVGPTTGSRGRARAAAPSHEEEEAALIKA